MKITAKQLTTEQKLRFLSGEGNWSTVDFDGNLPHVFVSDASVGLRTPVDPKGDLGDKPSVSYPSSQMLANTWNLALAREFAQCVADDCLDYGIDVLLGPGVNIKRNPLCGRNFEYYSEDPYLAGTIAREYVLGVQGQGIGACVKHFCCNNLEYNRFLQSSDVDERTLREIYYKPFEIAMEAKPVWVMCSYNKINGVQGSEYKKGFDVLRKEYGFDGAVMSDWSAVYNRAKALKAGLDLEMPYSEANYKQFVDDYEAGKVSQEDLDASVDRLLEAICRCNDMRKGKKPLHTVEERISFAQKAAEEGIVLLKNDGVLPLKKEQSVATCGLFAAPAKGVCANPNLVSGGGSSLVKRLTPMFDIPALLQKTQDGQVMYETGFNDKHVDYICMNPGIAAENAAACDVSIVFAGTGAAVETEGFDRSNMKLSECVERAILDSVSANPNTVVVLFAGAPVVMSAWINEVAAVVWAGFPGERGGEAIVNVLTGKVNPSGKLSETFPLHYEDAPAASEYIDGKVTRYGEGLDVGYRYYDTYNVDVLFPFGYGLSYANFEYKNLSLEKSKEGVVVSYEIENTSAVNGKEVSQVYVRCVSSYVYRPYKELKGFAKTPVKAGKCVRVSVELPLRAFAYWSTGKDGWDIEDGVYEIIVGASVEDELLKARVRIQNGEITLL